MASIIKKLINGILSDVIQLEHSAQDIDDSVTKASQLTGHNLLDNWYFADPVNQRGNTEYTALGYTIDRWEISDGQSGSMRLSIGDTYVGITAGADRYTRVDQVFEGSTDLYGVTVTGSALFEDGTLWSGSGVFPSAVDGVYSTTVLYSNSAHSLLLQTAGNGRSILRITANAGITINVKAVKLELGTQQTLARKAVDGTWVLIDPPPNKAEELAKCQRYCLVIAPNNSYAPSGNGMVQTTTSARIIIPTPVSLRVNPSILYTGAWQLLANGLSQTITAMSVAGSSTNAAQLDVASSGLVVGQGVVMRTYNDLAAKIILSADL